MAKTDTIPQLGMFKGQCKPIWLFMASGKFDLLTYLLNYYTDTVHDFVNKPCRPCSYRRKFFKHLNFRALGEIWIVINSNKNKVCSHSPSFESFLAGRRTLSRSNGQRTRDKQRRGQSDKDRFCCKNRGVYSSLWWPLMSFMTCDITNLENERQEGSQQKRDRAFS